jgi:parallel beta-helix repeat protein
VNSAIILSIFVVLFPLALPTVSASPTTWYVPDNFPKIQDAMESPFVLPGDTVIVRAGTYFETITIPSTKHNITLMGESRTNTTIDANHNGTVITISASWVNVTGFTVRNAGSTLNGIHIKSNYNTIYECNFEDSGGNGVLILKNATTTLRNNIIRDNDFINNFWAGVSIYYSIDTIIDNNYCDGNYVGVYLEDSSNNYIEDNNIYNSTHQGIHLYKSSNENYINNSYIEKNPFGILLSDSNNNTIQLNNRLINNSIDGIYLNGTSGSHGNIINGNNISFNHNIGINVSKSDENVIYNNDILFNNIYGISLDDSKDNMIFNNIVNNNTVYALYIDEDYRNNISVDNTFNGGNIYYVYDENGSTSQLNDSIQNKVLTSGINVTNVGRLSFIECSYFNVTNNTISNATKGIFLYNSNNITLDNNTIFDINDDGDYGLFIEEDYRHNITQNNTVNGEKIYYYYNQTGNLSNPIEIEIPEIEKPLNASHVSNVGKISIIDSSYLLVKNNNVSNGSFGIFLYGCEELTLWNNNISDSEEVGLYVTEGYHHNISDNNTVKGSQLYATPEYENIYYYVDRDNITVENLILTERRISNVGKLSFINCADITIRNNTLASWIGEGWTYGSGIFLYSSNDNNILDNTFEYNRIGVEIINSDNNNITNCSFDDKDGVSFLNSDNNYINDNTFTNGGLGGLSNYGVIVTNSEDITIIDNNLTSSHLYGSDSGGVLVTESNNIIISLNTFKKKKYAIKGSNSVIKIENNVITNASYGIHGLVGSDNSTKINNNTITNITSMGAIYLGVAGSSSPWIENNTISNLFADGIDVYHYDSAPYIYNNTIFDAGLMGIQLEDSNATIDNNKIYDVNTGINVNYRPGTPMEESFSNTTIINNEIWNCTKKPLKNYWGDGIFVDGRSIANIRNNKIYNNQDFGIHVRDNTNVNISNNNCSYNRIGIRFLTTDPNLTIVNNTAIGNSLHGIYTQDSDETLIINNNTLIDNQDGIFATNSDAPITNNTFRYNLYGIFIDNGGNPLIQNNIINWSNHYGIFARDSSPIVELNIFYNNENRTGGISSYFYACGSNTNITNNTYINSHRAVYLMYTPALVRDNNITLVEGITNGPYFDDTVGIAVYHLSDAQVINNTIDGGDRGIGIEYDSNAIIDNNNITNSNYYGIFTRNLNGTTITNNNITNASYAIYLQYSSSINITYNTILEGGLFIDGDKLSHWNTHYINISNTVNNNSVYYWKNQTGGVIPSGAGEVILANCTNVIVENQDLDNCSVGIEIGFSTNIDVTGNNASNNYYGIYLYNSSSLNLTNNNMIKDGIFIDGTLLEYWNTHNIDTSNYVNNKPVYYWKNQTSGTIPTGAGEIILANCTNIEIQTQELTNASVGVEFGFSSNNNISNINASNNIYGLFLLNSNQNLMNNSMVSSNNFGITLSNSCNNDMITNNASSNLYYGISIIGSINNNVTSNFTFNNIYGLYFSNSDNNNIVYSNATSNYYGFYLLNSHSNNLTNNNASSNYLDGTYLDFSSENNLMNNNASNNYYGIRFIESDNNTISNNTAIINDVGISITSSHWNNIINNEINLNNNALYLSNSNENNITNNNIFNNDYGIYLDSSSGNNITLNNATDNNYGIYLNSVNESNLMNNEASNNTYGIYLDSSSGNNITLNNATDNNYGIYLNSVNESNLISNDASNNNYGIYLDSSSGNNITLNSANSNDYGIYLDSSSGDNITSNNASTNDHGIYLWNSNNTNITENNASLNNDNGITVNLCFENKIGLNNFSNNDCGINLSYSDLNLITNNDILNNTDYGIYMSNTENNSIIDNDIYNNSNGIDIDNTNENNSIYHNNLNNTDINAFDNGSNNQWDNGLEGNWWSDSTNYTDSDGDGICDSNYTSNYFVDNYPLANEDNDRVLVDDPWFWFIQSGINFAESGWTVYANSDTYLENITINKTLTIIGEERDNTIVNGRGIENVIFINNTISVNIRGFTVWNGTNGIYLDSSLYCVFENNNLSNNNIGIKSINNTDTTIQTNFINWSNNYGIYAKSSSLTVKWNTFQNKDDRTGGITSYFYNCANSTMITNNTFINSFRAVYLMYTPALIRDNNITLVVGNTTIDDSVGIAVYSDSDANIINNTISEGDSGLRIESDSNATTNGNRIDNASYYGIYIKQATPLISQNILENNHYGIFFNDSGNILIQNNFINWSNSYGIYALDSSPLIEWNSFENAENRTGGIASYFYNSHSSTLISNNTYKNSHRAIYLMYSYALVRNNNISLVEGIINSDDTCGIAVYSQTETTIINNSIIEGDSGIRLGFGIVATIISNNITNSSYNGIYSNNVNSLEIDDNELINNFIGINFNYSTNSTIKNNDILSSSSYGIYANYSNDNLVYHNNFINNSIHAYDNGYTTFWDNGYPIGGNYWDNYTGVDLNSTSTQDVPPPDGIGDTRYDIDIDSLDSYPLMNPLVNNRVQRPPFRIDSNSDFDASHGVSAGSGTQNDPWIIENYDIDGAGYGYSIYLGNTTEYFVLRGSHLHDANRGMASPQASDSGIILENVTNGEITDNNASLNVNQGLYLNSSSFITIEDNEFDSNSEEGIELNDNCNNIEIDGNTITTNVDGIFIFNSTDINITKNSISENGDDGINISLTTDIIIAENIITGNYVGLQCYNSSPVIRYNDISYNNKSGIGDVYYSTAIIGNNTINYNFGSGIAELTYSNSTINNNSISYNGVGILAADNSTSVITYNNITYNTNGIDTDLGANVTIQWNNIHDNTNKSIRNFDSNITLIAWYNYWGSVPPDPSDFYGPVDYNFHETAPIEEAGPD